jgi:hypothetical protein
MTEQEMIEELKTWDEEAWNIIKRNQDEKYVGQDIEK